MGRQCPGQVILFVSLFLVFFVAFSGGGLGFGFFFCCDYFEPTSASDVFKYHVSGLGQPGLKSKILNWQ